MRTPNSQDQKRKFLHHKIIKKLNVQNKEIILKAARKNDQVVYKGRHSRVKLDFSMETLKAEELRQTCYGL